MGEKRIRMSDNLKYFGITLDGRLNFDKYIEIHETRAYLVHLLPNEGELIVRQLYKNIFKSKVLYDAPLWALRFQNVGVLILSRMQRLRANLFRFGI